MGKHSEKTSSSDLSDFFKIPVGIHWVEPDGSIIKATEYELNTLGYSKEELTKLRIKDLFVDKEEVNDILQKVKVGVDLEDYKTQLRCKDGSSRHVLINSDVHREDSKHIHTRFYVRDISEKRRCELSNTLLSAIIEDSNDAVFSKDLDGTIISWNNSAEHIFGYTATEVVGEPISIIIPEENLKEVEDNLTRIKQGERISHFETIRECKNGIRLNVSLNISPIKDAQGNLVGLSMIARDITERKQTEAKLISYQKQLKSLVSKLNKAEEHERRRLATELHDNLGQLLTMSKMKLEQFEKKSRPESQSPEINDLRDLINEATDKTRKLMTELSPPALDQEHFEKAIEWVAHTMEKHNLNVDIESDEQPISFEDEVQKVLIQSIRELLFNVVKHAGVDRAKIITSRKDSQVQIKVVDNGVGFDINSVSLASSEGKRFGLFNIKERVELLGGALKIHSEPEKGTIAELIAPLKEKGEIQASVTDGEQAEVLNTPPERGNQNGKINILLVDDHQIMRKGIRKLIEAESDMTIVAEASDGKEAIELAKKTAPDVIIMDINMPVMNGIEATKKILSDNPHITVIGLSVHNNDDVKRSMRKAGASVFLSKSEAFELLCATIRSEAKNKTP